ncbi:glycosyltransferase family 1 protein [Sphingobium sp. CECT 9361]|uniref:glycosyltransferase family 4 protein n=1 Tax=Sphingobium sp. CECT 9361 TaxID=2845384 RepID=UPI001E307A51|nr:glycosyltransferase family 1 protein [Sphingobium sp. CECT 9361]CAH0356893.1 D-inositol-3-phosphate glycosyltransferase [Sphingobium sp. CECT 9361]
MHILYDHNVFLRGPRSGVSRYFCEMITAASEISDDRMTISAPFHTNRMLDENRQFGRRWHFQPDRYTNAALRLLDEGVLLARLRSGRYNIIHETHYSGREYGKTNARPVYTLHDMIPELFPSLFGNYSKVLAKRAQAFRSDAHFVAISHNSAADLVQLCGVPEKHIRVIHHGTSALPDPGPIQRRDDLILFVGERGSYKNFDQLIAAFAQKPRLARDVELLAFGGGGFSDAERTAINRAGLRRVSQRGGDDRALAAAYRAATVFVYPSIYEGFGLPLLEAMALDCPVACSRASCFPEIAGDAATYFDPHDPDEMGEVISKLFDAPEQRFALTRVGVQRSRDFSWSKSAAQHLKFYQEIVQQ